MIIKWVRFLIRSMALGVLLYIVSKSAIMAAPRTACQKKQKAPAIVPKAPDGATLSKWLEFDRPITFSVDKIEEAAFATAGKQIWAYSYTAEKQSLYVFTVELHKAGSLFGTDRASFVKQLEQQGQQKKSSRHGAGRFFETRPDGRKVYFTPVGMGPGGGMFCIFTKMGAYDLVMTILTDAEDDMPEEEKLKNPATPKQDMLKVFQKLEAHIINSMKTPTDSVKSKRSANK